MPETKERSALEVLRRFSRLVDERHLVVMGPQDLTDPLWDDIEAVLRATPASTEEVSPTPSYRSQWEHHAIQVVATPASDGGEVRERVGEALKQFDDIRWADVIAALPADLVMWTWKYLRYVRSDLVAALELLGVEVEEGDPLASIPAAILSASGTPQGEGDRELWSDVDVWLAALERVIHSEEGDSPDYWAVVSLRDRVQMKLRATPTDRSESDEQA